MLLLQKQNIYKVRLCNRFMTPNMKNVNLEKLKNDKNISKVLYIRVTKENYEWMKKQNLSPSKVFNKLIGLLKEEYQRRGK